MGQFVKGDVVVAPFPFSDLTASKKRPALVVALLARDDAVLCQITGLSVGDSYALVLSNADFAAGILHQNSNIRPSRIFAADSNIIQYRGGVVTPEKIREVTDRIVEIVSA